MASMNLILGVIVNIAQEAHDALQSEMVSDVIMNKMEDRNHLLQMCIDMDADGTGDLTHEEFKRGYASNPEFRQAFEEMQIEEEDLDVVWSVMDEDGSGTVSYAEFLKEIYKLKGSGSKFMLVYI